MRAVVAIALLFSSCGGTPPRPDGGAGPYRLEVQGDQQIGLHYGQVRELALRYFDDHGDPIFGAEIRFKTFGDPAGSSLSRDRTLTDRDGWADVRLTAGAAESSFRVVGAADNAEDLDFDISVSKFAFVEIDPRVAYAGAGMGQVATVRALLYDDRRCAKLPPSPVAPAPLRAKSAPGPSAVLQFSQLLSTDYALVGRAESASGMLIAFGCVDLLADQLPPGGRVEIPVPLARVSPAIDGAWAVTTTLPIKSPRTLDAWRALTTCPRAPAQPLLDAIAVAVGGGPLADGIAAHRGPLDNAGCRPPTAMNTPSLDAQLQTLLTPNNAPALALPDVLTDLDAVIGQATLVSRLELAALSPPAAGPRDLAALHTIERVTLAGAKGAHPASYDPNALGFPLLTAKGVPARLDGDALTVGGHGFTVRLPGLWGRALGDVVLEPRQLPTTSRKLLGHVANAAERTVNNQKVNGCAAIEDLICKATGVDPCAVAAACSAALDALATGLDAAFAWPTGIDLTIEGTGMVVDGDGNLVGEKIEGGSFAAQVTVAAPAGMVGGTGTWTAAPGK